MNSADNVNSAKPLIITTLGLVSFTILSGLALSSTVASAEDIVDEINITVPVSCTMSGNGESSHNAEILNGHYDSNIGETTMKAYCNDGNGFAIYAIGYTDDTDGKNVLTSSTLGSEHDIVTGTATGPVGNDDTSQWAMKLSTITNPTPTYPIIIAGSADDTTREQGDPDYSSFQEVPNDYTLVAKRTSGTDINPSNQQTAEGSTLKTTYQAYISRTQVAGTYTGQVKYTLIHPNDATAPHKPIYMQDLTSATIAQLLPNTRDTAKVVDKRDEQEYTIAKLADGKYWMLDNLALDPTAPATAANMDGTNTNASTTAIANYLNGGNSGGVDGWSTLAVANTDSWSNSVTAPIINKANKDTFVTSYGLAAINGQAKIGIYYNYCAATVGTYCYEEGEGEDAPDSLIDAPEDICPYNWRLPTSNNGDFDLLYNTYNSTTDATDTESLQYNLSTPLSGNMWYNAPEGQNRWGFWWSSTLHNDYGYNLVYELNISPDSVQPNLIDDMSIRTTGISIRCLFNN